MTNRVITGIYLVEKKWDLIWLKNKIEDKEETLPYFKFQNFLYQSFDEDYIKKILEAINCEKKLLIDFDKSVVKIVVEKEQPFIKTMTPFFKVDTVLDWQNNAGEYKDNIYTKYLNDL